jgi:hypothetical protein
MSTKYRPSTFTAVLELMLVLALGLIVLGVARGWFVHAATRSKASPFDVTDRVPQPADDASEMRRAVTTPLWSTAGGTPSPFAAARSPEPGEAWTRNARTTAAEEQPN